MPRLRLIVALAAAVAPLSLQPASAQDPAPSGQSERINQVIVYGKDPCPRSSSPDEITVCARKDEGERYRIPEPLRDTLTPQNRSWTDRVMAYETVGNFGTNSCSPSGAGGFTGCTQQLIQQAYAERKQSSDVRFSELIDKERQRRLSTIDADARATQARVEEAEREYDARRRAAAAAEQDAAEASEPAPGATGN